MRRMRRVGAGLIGLALLAAPLPARAAPALDWQACGRAQCASLTVPLDYADPAAGTITLALQRSVHTGPTRQGSIVVNPGGPGQSGLAFSEYVAREIAPDVAREFDIIGFDPRGVGDSSPVTCMNGPETTRWLQMDPTPDTPSEIAQYMRLAVQIGQGCITDTPRIATHMGTEASARDLDAIRDALGEPTLNYLGFSYGTYLGTRYLELFPDRAGRFVLDGAVDPSLDIMQISRAQAAAFQTALVRFADDCRDRSNCVARTTAGVLTFINRLLAQVERRPMRTGGTERLNESQAVSALYDSLYSPNSWPALRTALSFAKQGDGSAMQSIANSWWSRTGRDTYATNVNSAFYAISCWDAPPAPGASGLATAARAWGSKARVPAMARAAAWSNAPCSTWFGHDPVPPHRASTTTSAPVLVVGTTFDPATPYPWAASLASQLPTSRLLTFVGDGHTAYRNNSTCLRSTIGGFLLSGVLPPAGTACR